MSQQVQWEIRVVNSTAIQVIAYNHATQTMRIIFKSLSGYDYPHTPEPEFLRLANSESVGRSFQPLRSERSVRLPKEAATAFYRAAIEANARTRVTLG